MTDSKSDVKNLSTPRYHFGEFTINIQRSSLARCGKLIKLRPKCFEVLSYLVENPGRLISKAELFENIWGATTVTEDSLTQCVIEIRRALGDNKKESIKTVPRRGYIFDLPVTLVSESSEPSKSKLHRKTIARRALMTAGVIAMAILVWLLIPISAVDERDQQGDPYSVAVLPFVDMSPQNDQEYFADGISEQILNLLAQTNLRVIARTSSFSFKSENIDVEQIANRLSVSHILEGSVRTSGNQIRITAQLIDTSNSLHLWSHTYDQEMGDIFAIQDDIAQAVAEVMKVKLFPKPHSDPAHSVEAFKYYSQGHFFHYRRAKGDVDRALINYKNALKVDPDYARAWVGIAGIQSIQVWRDDALFDEGWKSYQLAVENALAINPTLADAHARAFWVCTYSEVKRMNHLDKALSLEPNNALALAIKAGFAYDQWEFDEAVAWQKQAVGVDPLARTRRMNLVHYLFAAGRLAEAEEEARDLWAYQPSRSIESDLAEILLMRGKPEAALPIFIAAERNVSRTKRLALTYDALGRIADANLELAKLKNTRPVSAEAAHSIAQIYAYRDQSDSAFRWLATAAKYANTASEESQLHQALRSPFLKNLHDDARWQYWAARDWYEEWERNHEPAQNHHQSATF